MIYIRLWFVFYMIFFLILKKCKFGMKIQFSQNLPVYGILFITAIRKVNPDCYVKKIRKKSDEPNYLEKLIKHFPIFITSL